MTEPARVFEYGSSLYEFNKFFEFPKEKQQIVLESLAKTAETLVDLKGGHNFEVLDSQVEAAYNFAKAIDPNYKTWKENRDGYVVNPETEKLLIDYYELIKDKTSEQIREALKVLEAQASIPQEV